MLGPEGYGVIGLALLTANTLIFLGELGFTPFLVRTAAVGEDWRGAWARALTPKLVMTPPALALAFGFWGFRHGLGSPGALCLIAMTPGVLASLLNISPILYAVGAGRAAAAAAYLRWAIFAAGASAGLAAQEAELTAILVGAGFSVGLIAQTVLAARAGGLTPRSMRPILRGWRDKNANSALPLYGLMLIAALNDRAPPFIVESAAPSLLAATLLLTQTLSGITGLMTQFDRVILPILSQRRDEPQWGGLVTRLSLFWRLPGATLASVTAAGLLLLPEGSAPGLSAATPILLLLLAEWLLTLEVVSLSAAIIAANQDGRMARANAILLGLGLIAQIALLTLASLPVLMTARIGIQFASAQFNRGCAGLSAAPSASMLLAAILTASALTLAP